MTATAATTLTDGRWTVDPGSAVATFTVRNWGLLRVRGGVGVTAGTVTVAGGEPVSAAATLDAASVRTGIARRDADLAGRHFFDCARHPTIAVRTTAVVPDGAGWRADAVLTVAGGDAPLVLHVVRLPDPAPGTVRVRATGVLDRRATPIRVPRAMVGRWIAVEVGAELRVG